MRQHVLCSAEVEAVAVCKVPPAKARPPGKAKGGAKDTGAEPKANTKQAPANASVSQFMLCIFSWRCVRVCVCVCVCVCDSFNSFSASGQ